MAMIRYEPASRKNVDRETDPYKPRIGASDVWVCPTCHAICRQKRWYLDEKEYASLAIAGASARPCSACRKIADGSFAGVVTLRGRTCESTATTEPLIFRGPFGKLK